jgi:hypothetical protein
MRRFADAEWSRAVDARFALVKSVMQRKRLETGVRRREREGLRIDGRFVLR